MDQSLSTCPPDRVFLLFQGFEESAFLRCWIRAALLPIVNGTKEGIDMLEEVQFPDSLGSVYSTFTSYLGFESSDGEYKVMGLAPYGKPIYTDKIRRLVSQEAGGQFAWILNYFCLPIGR